MGKKLKQAAPFQLEGRFLGFEVEDGYKIKRLNIATADGEQCIKLTKEARASVQGVLTLGDWIRISGERSHCPETQEVKYKAHHIQPVAPRSQAPTAPPTKPKPKATILVCQKSDCMKRGGKALCQRLQQELSDRGLAEQVTIKGVGCMKECKAGPNLVLMPNKARYSRIQAPEIPTLLDRHFPAPMPQPLVPTVVAQPDAVEC